ncbi:MAG: HEAT repeat domain-containing protein [Gemmataceae bacterium]
MGPDAKDALPALVKALDDKELSVRGSVVKALGQIGAEAKDAVPALIKALKDKAKELREKAAYALGEIGPAAKDALPTLEALSENDPYPDVCRSAAAAIEKI